jgi:iron(III) transport system ATP-binding protein
MTTDRSDTPAIPALTLRGVSKRFGRTVALDDVDLELRDGELLALVGPSGCGKSTLLRVVAGLLGADRGEIRLGGAVVDDGSKRLDPERRHVGLVFQEHALFPHLSVGDNVAFGLRSLPRRQREAVRDRWLELVGLRAHDRQFPHELSGGERQRVALARALAPEPQLMLLDEPFASLDPNLRTQIRADVVGLLRATGTPAVFVTHDQGEAMAIGDRVAVMRAGRIEQQGSPETVFHVPSNRFVAGFMGDAAFLPIVTNGTGPRTELGPVDVPGGVGPTTVAMARPDDLTFEPAVDGPDEVLGAEFRGATWCYSLRLPSGTIVHSAQPHLVRAARGDRVRVSLVPGHRLVVVDEDEPAGL